MDLFSLFPAYAGVILTVTSRDLKGSAFPRIRGGDPIKVFITGQGKVFSPHLRG